MSQKSNGTSGPAFLTDLLSAGFNIDDASSRVEAPDAPRDEPLSFAFALRWLDRCQRLEGSGCAMVTRLNCDEALWRFVSTVDFSVGAEPAARMCATRSQAHLGWLRPARGSNKDVRRANESRASLDVRLHHATLRVQRPKDVWSPRLGARWLENADRLRNSPSLRVQKAHILDTFELTARAAFPDLLRAGRRIVDVGAGGGMIDACMLPARPLSNYSRIRRNYSSTPSVAPTRGGRSFPSNDA